MTPPVDNSEVLFRQAPRRGTPLFVDRTVTPPVHRLAFRPTPNDADGLSLIRAKFRSLEWSGYRPEKDDSELYVIQLIAEHLCKVAERVELPPLSFPCSPDCLDLLNGEPNAHCTIAQINRVDYDKGGDHKKRILSWTEKLSETIKIEQIHGPFKKPASHFPYRPA